MSGHDHGAARDRLAVVLAITVTVLLTEVVGALVSGSLALLADAGHMLTDVAGLTIALLGAALAGRPATSARTWGYQRAEVLAATEVVPVVTVAGRVIVADPVAGAAAMEGAAVIVAARVVVRSS